MQTRARVIAMTASSSSQVAATSSKIALAWLAADDVQGGGVLFGNFYLTENTVVRLTCWYKFMISTAKQKRLPVLAFGS